MMALFVWYDMQSKFICKNVKYAIGMVRYDVGIMRYDGVAYTV